MYFKNVEIICKFFLKKIKTCFWAKGVKMNWIYSFAWNKSNKVSRLKVCKTLNVSEQNSNYCELGSKQNEFYESLEWWPW